MKQRSQTLDWHQLDQQTLSGLETDTEHHIQVRREAIPLIFVPGIMGSRLRRGASGPRLDDDQKLPALRWDAGDKLWMAGNFLWRGAEHRKRMLVGPQFSTAFLEVDDTNPVGDGFNGIMADYRQFLVDLRDRDWGALGRLFVFPVYAHGYNWTDSNENGGRLLAQRITQVIDEARQVTGLCEKVILITHSMGGLVARAASEMHGARGRILGIVHGVQPATGATAAYWRIKAGFEGDKLPSGVLGNEGPDVCAILGNVPGGLQLLPTKHHRTNAGERDWLRIVRDGKVLMSLPQSDPYTEIYEQPAVVVPPPGKGASGNAYWGLVDPALLDPGNAGPPAGAAGGLSGAGALVEKSLPGGVAGPAGADGGTADAGSPAAPLDELDAIDQQRPPVDPWAQYLEMLGIARAFHDALGLGAHPHTFCLRGTSHTTADVIRLELDTYWVQRDSYQTRGFFGYLRDEKGEKLRATLQDPDGEGDATVPLYSAGILNGAGKPPPGDADLSLEHQPAYENGGAQTFTLNAIKALCEQRFKEQHG